MNACAVDSRRQHVLSIQGISDAKEATPKARRQQRQRQRPEGNRGNATEARTVGDSWRALLTEGMIASGREAGHVGHCRR